MQVIFITKEIYTSIDYFYHERGGKICKTKKNVGKDKNYLYNVGDISGMYWISILTKYLKL